MKVAFVPHAFSYTIPPYFGDSVAILTYETARRLTQFCEVVIYNKGQTRFWKQRPYYDGIRYRYVRIKPDRWLQKMIQPFLRLFKSNGNWSIASWYYALYALQIALDLRRIKCDIVHIHTYSQLVPIIRAFNPKIKIVLHMHCEWLTQSDYTLIEQRLRQTDLIIGCSSHITTKIRQCFPQFANRCQTVYNGVDVDEFFPAASAVPTEENTLLFVGRVSPEKGVHDLIEAFPEVARHSPNTRLELAGPVGALDFNAIVGISDDPDVLKLARFYQGDADYYAQLKARIPAELEHRVIFHNQIPHNQIADYYRRADILINPSLSEAFGMSLVEGMATATSVIGTRIGGMTDIVIDRETGFLVEPANPKALAEAMIKLLCDDGLRQKIGKQGRQRVVEMFSWERIAESLIVHYRNLCS